MPVQVNSTKTQYYVGKVDRKLNRCAGFIKRVGTFTSRLIRLGSEQMSGSAP
jgi:hypothetical protein